MKTLLSFLFAVLLWANSCTNTPKSQQQTNEQLPSSTQKEVIGLADKIEKNSLGGWEEFDGNRILNGELYTSKGAILAIEDVFISEDYKAGSSKKPELQPLIGRVLEIKGDVYIYHCGPQEQCLTEGSMKWMRNVEYVKVAEE
ncbi:MAG: hypothetical protein R3E32_15290 [Chitinophagales bacterium]